MIDQIFYSLNRFSEFNSLPPDFIANLYPFNISKEYVHNYENYSLITENYKLHNLFFDQIEYVDDEVKFKPPHEMNFTPYEVIEYERKLRDIIKILNSGLIFYLFKKNDKPRSFDSLGWSDSYKKLQVKNNSKCHCFNCCLNRLEYQNVIEAVFSSSIDETTSIQDDLSLSYVNYKIGNFHQSYLLFEDVAKKSWQAGKYLSYYIAKHNIKTLRNLVIIHDNTLIEEERNRLIGEMDKIDLDKLLFQVQFMGISEYELLKFIRDDKILHNAEQKIEETYKSILKNYNAYKRGRTRIVGPYYPKTVEIELKKIISFYVNNYIIIDEYSNFTKVCSKGIEALLISYATSDNYEEKLKEFDKMFFDVVVSYGEAREIKETLNKFKIGKIDFDSESLIDILDSINNYFKSFFEINTIFKKRVFPNRIIKHQITNDFFVKKCRKQFRSILLLMSGVEISEKIASNLVSNLLGFIQQENYLHQEEIEYLSSFILKNYKLFSREELIGLLKSMVQKIHIYNSHNLLQNIAFSFTENHYLEISEESLIFKILSLCEPHEYRQNVIVNLWKISDNNIKDKLKKKILLELDEKFNADLYRSAVFADIIAFDKYFEQYVTEIDKTKGDGQYSIQDGKPIMQSLIFINAANFIYNMKVNGDDIRLQSFTHLSDYMKFYLFPEKFNYNDFKSEWLLIFPHYIFFERFKQIKEIRVEIETSLKKNFDMELAEIYIKYFI